MSDLPKPEFSTKSYREVIFYECGRRTDGCAYKVETLVYYRGRMLGWHCSYTLHVNAISGRLELATCKAAKAKILRSRKWWNTYSGLFPVLSEGA